MKTNISLIEFIEYLGDIAKNNSDPNSINHLKLLNEINNIHKIVTQYIDHRNKQKSTNSYRIEGQWLNDLEADFSGSDRACAVLGGAIADDYVKMLLKKYLLPPQEKKKDKLLDRSSPLESFASRIELARRLNLITKETRKSLDWVRDIRNDAAHETDFSFSNDSAKDRVSNILQAMKLKEKKCPLLLSPYDTPKGQFIAAVIMLVACLNIEIGETTQTQHEPTDAISNASFS
ncbi:MAG: DUF4145 domain-containing protein [Nitrospirae bacterium]|nr:DUF4145 domain-containing protein [Nitrospirota bacterium]